MPSHVQPRTWLVDGTPGHVQPCPATVLTCLLSSRPWQLRARTTHAGASERDASGPTPALRARSETKKMQSPTPIDTTVIAPTARSHPVLVKMGAHGAQNSSTTAAASAATPTITHRASTPHGVRWACRNFSGNERLTKKTSLKSSTIDVHHPTVTAASSTR